MRFHQGLSRWMGLDASQVPASDEIPRWHGVTRQRVASAQLAWMVTGIAIFIFLKLMMPTDDFSGYMPIIGAVLVFALGLTFTERHMIRVNSERKTQDDIHDQ